MNNAAAAPAPLAPTAPATVAGASTQEVTMSALTAARAAVEAIEAEVHDLMACDDTAFDADLADRHERALAALRAAEAQVTAPQAVRWVVEGRRLATRRVLRWAGEATSRADAVAQAQAKWGAGALVDAAGEVIR